MVDKRSVDTSNKSFDEVLKTSYSHGLESIYKIENIDLKTIRKLGGYESIAEKKPELRVEEVSITEELSLDLGPVHSGYISSFVVREPLQSLRLSKHTEKSLLDLGMLTLQDLRQADLSQLVYVKGMGQGHIVEVKEKLVQYLAGKSLDKSHLIDFSSWVKSLIGELEPKTAWIILNNYGLADEVTLSPLESVELKKITIEKRQELAGLARKKIASPDKVKEVRERLSEIESVFLRPWINARFGVATELELMERLEKMSLKPSLAGKALKFIQEIYTEGGLFNLPKDNTLHFSDVEYLSQFCKIEDAVRSYLWNSNAEILYLDLLKWLRKDFSKKWTYLEEKHLYKVISLSSKFTRKKLLSGDLLIKSRSDYIRK